jgi:ribosomal protein S18 acetylase RimI-like enzyme
MVVSLNDDSIRCVIHPFLDRDFDDYAETLFKTWPCDDIQEARQNVTIAVNRIRESKNEEIWVAEVKGRAIGFMLLEFTKVWGHKGEAFNDKAVGIDWFDVHPDFQHKGIGSHLLRKAEERAKEKKLSRLFMHTSTQNLKMINFASTKGFRFVKYLKEFWGKGTEDAFLLIKDL